MRLRVTGFPSYLWNLRNAVVDSRDTVWQTMLF
jgi:hypothetical protein